MQLGETSGWHAAQAAGWPDLVAVRSPDRHGHPGLMQGLEPALVQVLVTELAVEALGDAHTTEFDATRKHHFPLRATITTR